MLININEIRNRAYNKGLTENELLRLAGLNSDYLSAKRRSGTGSTPTAAAKIAAVLECDISEITTTDTPHPARVQRGFLLDVDEIRSRAYNKGLTEKELLKRAGLNPSKLSNVRHQRQRTNPSTAAKIAAVLECSPIDITVIDEEAF